MAVNGTASTSVGIKLKGNSSLMGPRGQGSTAGGADGNSSGGGADTTNSTSTAEEPMIVMTSPVCRSEFRTARASVWVAREFLGYPSAASVGVMLPLLSSALGISARPTVATGGGNAQRHWYTDTVGASGILYKAEAGGDYSYHEDNPAAYAKVFEVEATTSLQTNNQYVP